MLNMCTAIVHFSICASKPVKLKSSPTRPQFYTSGRQANLDCESKSFQVEGCTSDVERPGLCPLWLYIQDGHKYLWATPRLKETKKYHRLCFFSRDTIVGGVADWRALLNYVWKSFDFST
jgi:hypothetical protein